MTKEDDELLTKCFNDTYRSIPFPKLYKDEIEDIGLLSSFEGVQFPDQFKQIQAFMRTVMKFNMVFTRDFISRLKEAGFFDKPA